MRLYLRSSAVISPQERADRPQPLTGDDNVRAHEPDYGTYIARSSLRRMDRASRFGLYAAYAATDELVRPELDGIVMGIGQSFSGSDAKMLRTLKQHDEGMSNPTTFMNSLLSTAGGHVALQFGCSGYNNTFTQRGFTFESALLDVVGRLAENPGEQYLVTGVDSYCDDYPLLADTYGHVSAAMKIRRQVGEGAAAFVVTARPHPDDLAYIEKLGTCFLAHGNAPLLRALREAIPVGESPDLVLSGRPRLGEASATYDAVYGALPRGVPVVHYKEFCGEYMTASAYGLHLAGGLLAGETQLPDPGPPPRSVLLINSFGEHYFSLIYLKTNRS